MTIGEKIRDIRLKHGLTQADLGGDLVTPSMISQIEADRAKPSYSLLAEIANRLGMPLDYFMNSIDHQFLFSAQLSVASYEFSMGRPEQALEQLKHLPEAPGQGLNHQEYVLMMAQAARKLKRFSEAVSHLEHLRELAYRTQDNRLLFLVYRESGYVEYDVANVDGAIHEWQQAVHIAHQLEPSDVLSSLDLVVLTTEILLRLDTLTGPSSATSGPEPVRVYLDQAAQWTAKTLDLRTVTDRLMEDSLNCIMTDPAKSKTLADKANTLIAFARMVEQRIAVQSRLAALHGEPSGDSWQQTAFAMTTIYPETYLQTACDQIDKHLKSGQIDAARQELQHAHEILQRMPMPENMQGRQDTVLRLQLLEAQLQELLGHQDDSITALVQLEASYPASADVTTRIKACALLVLWYGERRDTEKVLLYCKRMEQLMAKDEQNAPLFI